MSHELTYGLVRDNQVILYPLTITDINQRNDPTESYLICYYDPHRPVETLTHKVIQAPVLVGTAIFVSERIETKNVTELFEQLHATATSYDENNQPYLDRTKVGPEMYTTFLEIVRIEVQAQMDAFAKMRVFRDPTHPTDTFNAKVHAWCCDLHYQIARFGTARKAPNFYG